MGTLHDLACRRADWEEAAQWQLLAERAGHVLAALEAAAAGTLPDLGVLAAETAGLRAALDAAVTRRIAVAEVAHASYSDGLAAGRGGAR